jgi:hypothetical protein
MHGKSHTPETVSKISDSQQLVDRSGANNPMYGKVAANAMTINVYSLDGKLINSFSLSDESCCSFMVKYLSNTSFSIY